jgi:DNA-binding transcriptional regulator PaaX
VILAIAIKQLMAEKTFEPAETELREALGKVKERLSMRGGGVERWLEKLYEWDARIFERDRAAWDAAYANVGSDVVRQMRERLELMDQGPCEDEDGNQIPPSPCWLAVNELCEAKQAEEAAKLAAESEVREAACKTTPAKKTRKPKRGAP